VYVPQLATEKILKSGCIE